MANISMKRNEVLSLISEKAGYKSGISINYNCMIKYFDQRDKEIFGGDKESFIRFRPEEYEQAFFNVLYGVGYLRVEKPSPHAFEFLHKYKNDAEKFETFQNILQMRNEWMKEEVDRNIANGGKSLDPTTFIDKSERVYGNIGLQMCREVLMGIIEYGNASPWSDFRRIEWHDSIELKQLFESEALEASYGTFIDQRYIDYLYRNFDDIDGMHWRKFEALTCEYFSKEGYYVEIGKGRNDEGVDARIWPKMDDKEAPPTMLIQCKRQKDKISKTIVKALWADVTYEKAESGLIVTSTAISPGAKKTMIARGYNVTYAERDTLRQWIKKMRTPFEGYFLGE